MVVKLLRFSTGWGITSSVCGDVKQVVFPNERIKFDASNSIFLLRGYTFYIKNVFHYHHANLITSSFNKTLAKPRCHSTTKDVSSLLYRLSIIERHTEQQKAKKFTVRWAGPRRSDVFPPRKTSSDCAHERKQS